VAAAAAAVAAVAILALAGCGADVQSADLFLLTRTGQGTRLTLLVNDSGTIRCNGAKARMISNEMLIAARDLAENLSTDASHNLFLKPAPGTVFSYRISLEQGVIRFSDRDTAHHPELARAQLFAAQVAQRPCGLNALASA
jgi:hypothetical protein